MIIESGLIVAGGLLFTFTKFNWAQRMWMLSRPLFMDLVVFVLLNFLHWGTFSGLMVAATGALVCSGLLSFGRWYFGHVDKGVYYPGVINVVEKIKHER